MTRQQTETVPREKGSKNEEKEYDGVSRASTGVLVDDLPVKLQTFLEKLSKDSGKPANKIMRDALVDFLRGAMELETGQPRDSSKRARVRCDVLGCESAASHYMLITKFPLSLENSSITKRPYEIMSPLCELHARIWDLIGESSTYLLEGPAERA